MKKLIIKLGIFSALVIGAFFLTVDPVKAQSDCTPNGCWNAITSRVGWPAMYCGTCTYIDNSMGLAEHGTSSCLSCGPGIGL